MVTKRRVGGWEGRKRMSFDHILVYIIPVRTTATGSLIIENELGLLCHPGHVHDSQQSEEDAFLMGISACIDDGIMLILNPTRGYATRKSTLQRIWRLWHPSNIDLEVIVVNLSRCQQRVETRWREVGVQKGRVRLSGRSDVFS